jgi:uroporphyrinogen decarboxylase
MTSRQRILTALSHREPDRVPYDLGGIGPSSISMGAYKNLLNHLSLNEDPELDDIAGQRAKPSETFLERFGVDTRPLRYGPHRSWKLNIQDRDGYSLYFDEWGIGQKKSQDHGQNYFIFHHPLSRMETRDLPHYLWPDPLDPQRLEGLEQNALEIREKADPVFVFGGSFSQGFLQFAAQLEGHERFFMNLLLDPFRVEWVLNKLLEMKLSFYLWALERLRGWVDIISESDDLGHQSSQWLSLEMFRKFVKPLYSELFSTLKKKFEVKVLFHSCGAIYPFIPELIEMGVDILNPIQLGASGMGNTRKLKKEFGDALTFWGGGVDVQQMLPTAAPQMIKDEVKRRIEDLAPAGGFVFAATQTIQPDTPPENIMAMKEALEGYGIYSAGMGHPHAT